MAHWMKRLVIVAVVAVMAVSVIGVASAQGPGGRGRGGAGMGVLGGGMFGVQAQLGTRVLDAVTEATGLSLTEVHTQLRDGQSLNDILEANGADPAAVSETVITAVTADIDAAVEDGTLTQARADALKAQLPDALDNLLSGTHPMFGEPMFGEPLRNQIQLRAEDSLIAVLAELAGVDVSELLQNATQPPTLADIAESYGLNADDVIAEAEARITDEINSRVEAGTLTEEQAATLLENLNQHLTDRFNAPLFGGRFGYGMDEWGMGFGGQYGPGMMDDFGMGRGGRNFGPGMGRGGMHGYGPGMGGFWGGDSDDSGTSDSGLLQS